MTPGEILTINFSQCQSAYVVSTAEKYSCSCDKGRNSILWEDLAQQIFDILFTVFTFESEDNILGCFLSIQLMYWTV